jgi:hypothetical protein
VGRRFVEISVSVNARLDVFDFVKNIELMGRQLKTSEAFSKSTHCESKYSRNVSALANLPFILATSEILSRHSLATTGVSITTAST